MKSVSKTNILGIEYHATYEETCKENWEKVKSKISRLSTMLEQRVLTIYQKSIVINFSILSKVWYLAHTFPLSKRDALAINSCVFRFLWRGMYQPIKRATLCLPKAKGGLGIIDVYHKALAILCCTVLKAIANDSCLAIYYCRMRISYLIQTKDIKELSYVSNSYYSIAIMVIRKVIRCKNFPSLSNKIVYNCICPDIQPVVNSNYPLFNWEQIWKNVNNSFIGLREREFLYRYIHETLATNKRLKMLKIKTDSACDRCGQEETSIHIFYTCPFIKDILLWFQEVLFKLCNVEKNSYLKIFMLDFRCKTKKISNVALVLIVDYLYVLWVSKKKDYSCEKILSFLKSKIVYSRWLLGYLLNIKMKTYFDMKYINYDFNQV